MLATHCLLVSTAARADRNTLKHRLGEFTGKRVFVGSGDKSRSAGCHLAKGSSTPCPNLGRGLGTPAVFLVRRKKRIEGDLAERNHDPGLLEQFELAKQIRSAPFKFNKTGLISGRSATHRRRNVTILKFWPSLRLLE